MANPQPAFQGEAVSSLQLLSRLREQLKRAFIGRDAEIDGMILALMAKTHVLFLGPPGTAKSLLAKVFSDALGKDGEEEAPRFFERLLTAFTAPDELYGPFDIGALDEGRYERAIDGYLPTAHVSFLDEIFKANSAVLNSLLTLINERMFDNGTTRIKCPLQLVIGASNEYPADSSLEALYDRFQLRFWTEYVSSHSDMMRLLSCPDPATQVTAKLGLDDIAEIQDLVRACVVPKKVCIALINIRIMLAKEGIIMSDRRTRQAMNLISAKAVMDGRSEARISDLTILCDSVWTHHDQRPKVVEVVMSVARPPMAKAIKIYDAAKEVFDGIDSFNNERALTEPTRILRAMEGELAELCDDCDDEDVRELAKKVRGLRQDIGRRFARAGGALNLRR